MNFAIIRLAGKQHFVSDGDVITINDTLPVGKLEIGEVLLQNLDGTTTIGTPLVAGAKVTAEVVSNEKGDKVRVAKFKAKSRYRKVIGFRAKESTVKIVSVGGKEGREGVEGQKEKKARKTTK